MEKIRVVEPGQKLRSKDRDGLYKRRDYWHYELIIDGKKRSFTTATKDYNEAKKKRARAIHDLERGRAPDNAGHKRFEATADEYMKHRKATVSEGTVRLEEERLGALKRVLGNVRLKDITSRKIRAYQGTRGAEVSNRTVNLETKLLRGILKHEGQWAGIQPDYKRLRESGESPGRALTPDESLRLFTTAESKDGWMVAYRAAIVANDSGMRSVELRNLRLADVDTDARRITIRKSKGDNGLFRTVILTNDALKAVLALLDRADNRGCCRPEHYLFPFRTRNGAGYDPTKPMKGWRKAWRAVTKAAGVPGFRFHDLRHTFITNHAEMGTPFPVVQAQAGHLSKRMTELYTHISQRSMEDAARRYEQRKAELLAEAKKRLLERPANENQPPVN
jgi:integrase